MKKVLFIIDKPNLYGSELHLLKLVNFLISDYQLTVVSLADGPMMLRLPDIVAKKVFNLGWIPTFNFIRLLRFAKENRFDFIHGHQPKAALIASIIGRLHSITSFITIHSLPENNKDSYENFLAKSLTFAFHTGVKYMSELLASKIIYLSQFTYQRSAFKVKSIIIPNWVDVVENVKTPRINGSLRLLYIGSLSYQKGIDRLIKGLALLKNHSWHLDIVGDGEPSYVADLKQSIVELDINDRIEFHGYRDSVEDYFKKANVFILLSRGETFGMVYLEAMSYKLGVVAWEIPAVKDLLPSGNLVISRYDQLDVIFSKSFRDNLENLGEKNYEIVKRRYSSSVIKEQYLKLYD